MKMNNEIKNLLTGIGLIFISFILFVFRNKLSKVPPNKLGYYSEEQTKFKIYMVSGTCLFFGIWMIYLAFFR